MLETTLFQRFIDDVCCSFDQSALVSIFNTQNKDSIRVLLGYQVCI